MFNVTDERHIGVDLVLLFCHFYLKSLDSPNTLNYRYRVHKMASLYQTTGISNQALVFVRDVEAFLSRTDISAKSAILTIPPPKMVQSKIILAP